MLEALQKEMGNDLAIVFKHYPLSFHKDAAPAAKASLAAGEQGKFWEFHDKCFANQRELNEGNFITWATELGLDIEKFKKDMADPKWQALIDKDMAEGNKAGVRGTPSLYINGRKFQPAGGFSPDAFKAAFKEL